MNIALKMISNFVSEMAITIGIFFSGITADLLANQSSMELLEQVMKMLQ